MTDSKTPHKKRILYVGETPTANSGFGKITKELLTRLYKTGKYEIAELSGYGTVNNPKENVPWMVYPNAVKPDDPRIEQYNSDQANQFGKWRFERVCLDFRPSIISDSRDPWDFTFEDTSPYRRFYHWLLNPTFDSAPCNLPWLQMYMNADSVLSYSQWAYDCMKKESGGKMKLAGNGSPGVDINIFHPPVNKKELRAKLGLPPDANIVCVVMRNQKRKLYSDLFIAFRKFLDLCIERGQEELVKKTFLYVHTSYPDSGWNLARLLKEERISHKVYFTYICRECNQHFGALFSDARTVCARCGKPSALCPSVSQGISEEELSEVYQCMDLYIQYAICEGCGMPQLESGACGVPIMSVDYSAMSTIVRDLEGTPLKVKTMFRELETDANRAYPDNDFCAEKIYEFFMKPQMIRDKLGARTRELTEKHYGWDVIAKIWEDHLDSIQLTGDQGKWDAPPRFYTIPTNMLPDSVPNSEFVRWILADVMKTPEKIYEYEGMHMLQTLNFGAQINGRAMVPFNRKNLFDVVVAKLHHINNHERARINRNSLPLEDYIEYAHLKKEIYG